MVVRLIAVLVILCDFRIFGYTQKLYKIGGIFSNVDHEIAFRLAAHSMNNKYPSSQIQLVPVTYSISVENTLEAYQLTCQLFQEGIIALFGPSSVYSSPYIQSICDAKEIPHIEIHRDLKIKRNDTLVNIYPHPSILSNLFVDLIQSYEWHRIVIIYDTNESMMSVRTLLELNTKKHKTVVLRQLESDDGGDYRPMLTNVKTLGETRFVLVCSIDILEDVLKQLQQVGMMTEIYSYIIANLDMQTINLSPFQFASTNITGIRLINPEQTSVIQIAEDIHKHRGGKFTPFPAWHLNVETALIVDAVHLFYETVYDLTVDKRKTIETHPIFCRAQDSWNNGYSIINLMKSRSTHGITGPLNFDVEGFRRNFRIGILELSLGGLIEIGEWNSTTRIISLQRPNRSNVTKGVEENPFNRTFIVLISITPPYGMLRETTTQLVGNDRFEGLGIDVIDEISKILQFNYTLILQDDGIYGNLNKTTNQWNGMIREIIDGRADLAITDLTVTSERESAVDFSMPFMNLGISILYRKPEPVPPSLFMFMSPFSKSVWLMLGVSYFIVSISFFIMGRLSPGEWQNPYPCVEEPEYLVNQFTIRNSLWFTIGALMQQGSELAPISISTRTASGIWWLFVLIMVSSYTANLAAFLTVETLVTPFKDIEELAAQKEIKFGAKKNGATANYFRDSNLTMYKEVWRYMVKHPELMMTENEDGVEKVKTENYAFLMESTTIEYVTERHCTLAQVGGLLDDKGYGIAMKKDSPYRNDLSTAVLQLQEKGILTSLKLKWWKEQRGGGNCASKSEQSEATALDLKNVGGVFLVLYIGTLLGVLGSLGELVFFVYRKSKRENIPFKEEFLKEIKFILQFKQSIKELAIRPEDNSSDKNLINNKTYV